MSHPFTLWLPVLISIALQSILWFGDFFYLDWLDRTAILWMSIAGFSAAGLFLVIYRWVASEMEPWSLGLIFASLLQFATMGSSGYFLWRILMSLG